MTTVIVIPVLRRPHRVIPLIESIDKNTTSAYRTLFVCTPGDDDEIAAVEAAEAEYIVTPEPYDRGDYAKKINLAYRATWEPHIFCGADDLVFHPWWLEHALKYMTGTVGVVGTNDLGNKRVTSGLHATHSLVSRTYVHKYGTADESNKILHDGYMHNFVDDELVITAKRRNAWAFAEDSHVEHMHPHWQKAPMDSVYEHGLSGFDVDRRRFREREHLWR